MAKSSLKRRSDGFSLIEVLIAMLILAFGVLSMGGLQLASLRGSQMAANSSTAATLAKEYTEMMRANPSISNITSTTPGANPYLFDTGTTSTYTVSPSNNCQTTTCTAAQISVLQIADWAKRVKEQMPAGRAVVCRDPAPRNSDGTYKWSCGTNTGVAVTIKLGWVDKRDSVERGATATMTTTLANPQVVIGGLTGFAE